jgi:hypothetical protein
MLYRDVLVQLGEAAAWYLSELSHRRRAHLRAEVLGVYALYEQYGAPALLAAMAYAAERGAYSAEYLQALLGLRGRAPGHPAAVGAPAAPVAVAGPRQEEIDRQLSLYEAYVWADPPDVVARLVAGAEDGPPEGGR